MYRGDRSHELTLSQAVSQTGLRQRLCFNDTHAEPADKSGHYAFHADEYDEVARQLSEGVVVADAKPLSLPAFVRRAVSAQLPTYEH